MEKEMKKQKLLKWWKSDSAYLKVFLIFFVTGYMFFFSSNYFFHGASNVVTPTEYSEDLRWNGRVMQLQRWVYDEARNMMEVELSIEQNVSLDGTKEYVYTSKEYDAGELKVNAVAETEDMLVVQIMNVPKNYTIVSLHVNIPSADPQTDLILYENNRTISNQSIQDFSVLEYISAKTDRLINEMKNHIKDSEKTIEQQYIAIENGKNRLSELEEKLEYETGKNYEKTEGQISELKVLIDGCYQTINVEEANIKEYKLQIENAKALLEKYVRGE